MTTILAVDDSVTMRRCLEITFTGTEFNMVTCDSALEALEKVKTIQPDLVIADVTLPPGDGYELCTTIKLASPETPVLMLTSKHQPFNAARGAQADDHIDKPFDTQALRDKARDLIKERPIGDTDIPKSFGDRLAPVLGATKPVVMPQNAPPGKIPAPRKRPTPAMMSSPIRERQPPSQARRGPLEERRRTVPFAVPPGGAPNLSKTQPGVQPDAVAPGEPPKAPAKPTSKKHDLSKTMAFPAKLEDVHPAMGQPRQAAARGGVGATPEPFERAQPPTQPRPARPAPAPTGDTMPGASAPQAPRRDSSMPPPPPQQAAAPRRPTVSSWPAPPPPGETPQADVPRAAATGVAAATGASAGNGAGFDERLRALGLTSEQVEGVLALSREVVERVVWEVVPTIAETLIAEEIRRLTTE